MAMICIVQRAVLNRSRYWRGVACRDELVDSVQQRPKNICASRPGCCEEGGGLGSIYLARVHVGNRICRQPGRSSAAAAAVVEDDVEVDRESMLVLRRVFKLQYLASHFASQELSVAERRFTNTFQIHPTQ